MQCKFNIVYFKSAFMIKTTMFTGWYFLTHWGIECYVKVLICGGVLLSHRILLEKLPGPLIIMLGPKMFFLGAQVTPIVASQGSDPLPFSPLGRFS